MVDMDASDDDEERVVTDEAEMTSADAAEVDDPTSAEALNDVQLYREYQHAKEHGPQLRLDELQLEVAQRWEDLVERNLLEDDG